MAELNDIQFIDFANLTEDLSEKTHPDLVLSPLMGDDFDVVDIARQLHDLAFHGRYRAISENIPNADLVRDEVQFHAPGLDFDLLILSNDSSDPGIRPV